MAGKPELKRLIDLESKHPKGVETLLAEGEPTKITKGQEVM